MNSATTLTGVIRHLQVQTGDSLSDRELLADYNRRGNQAAFAAIVQRCGGLVLGVARRQLADRQQAEDVFQATFLALARSANRLGGQTPLINWLYTVALRQARKLRARSSRREELERTVPPISAAESDPLAEITGRDLVRVVDEELARLPEKYRLPVLLCCVRGLSREEAAGQLGWSDGAVKGRLERGRRRLAERLAARGLAPSVVLLAPVAAVVVPAELFARAATIALAPWSKTLPTEVVTLTANVAPRRFLAAMALTCSLVMAGVAGWAIASAGREPKDPPPAAPVRPVAADPGSGTSDPLPPGSTLRFGTSRYRQGTEITNLSVSTDGKLAVAASGGHVHGAVRAFDLTDGRALYTLGPVHPYAEAIGLAHDGKTLAVKASNTIFLFEAATGKELRKVVLADTRGGTLTEWIAFTPDNKAVALTQGDARGVVLVDLEKGEVARNFPHANVVYAAAFSPDGTLMAAGGYDSDKGTYFGRLWEVATGKELRRLPHGGGGLRTLAFSPDGKTLAGGGDGGWARLWEVNTGKELKNFPKAGYRVRSVAFAPDQRSLAVAGDAVRLFDTATGKERTRIDRRAIGLRFSADSRVLTGAVTGTIHQWEAATGKLLTPQAAGESAVDQILVTRDARKLVTRGQDGDAHIWDAQTGDHVRQLQATWQRGMALSPDGRFLVWPSADEKAQFKDPAQPNWTHTGSRLRLYDLTADKFIDRFPGFDGDAQELDFGSDGRTLITVDHRDGAVRLWDVATGKVERSFKAVRENEKVNSHFVWKSVLSPDGRTLAVTYQPSGGGFFSPFAVRLWDVATGVERHEFAGHYYYIDMAFSPDSRMVVTCSQALSDFAGEQLKRPTNQVFVWDVVTGKRIAALPDGLPAGGVAAVFSPDGRTLATATPEGVIQLWEVATWTVRAEHRGHRDRVNSLTFASDGRLFSGGLDTTVLAWDVRPPKAAGSLDAAWDALAKPDGASAFKAQGNLLAAPADAVKLIAGKVKPAERAEPKQLAGLIADLDSPVFATRERATKGLADIGRPALAALREALGKSESSEVRKRATDLIEKIDQPTYLPQELRTIRAIEVLEWVGSPEACEILVGLAKGDPSVPTTPAANAALNRLKANAAGRSKAGR